MKKRENIIFVQHVEGFALSYPAPGRPLKPGGDEAPPSTIPEIPSANPSSLKKSCKFFTLLEVLVSMAVFTILMLSLMQFFGSAQKIWTGTGQKNIMYENARVAMDLMSRDLQCAFYEWDRVPFLFVNSGSFNSDFNKLCFVTVTSNLPNASCKSRLCEVQYYVDRASGDDQYSLVLSITGDNSINWDFYKASNSMNYASDTAVNGVFTSHDTPPLIVIPYVTGLQFTCFDRTGAALANNAYFPYGVKIDLWVMDRESFLKWKGMGGSLTGTRDGDGQKDFRILNERKFSRTVIIGEKGQTGN